MKRKPNIDLMPQERGELERYCRTGVRNVRLVRRAQIILALDTSGGRKPERQEDIAARIGVDRRTLCTAKNDFLAAKEVSTFLRRKKRKTPPVPPKITGDVEARITALACGEPPKGYARWTMQLLASKCVELKIVDSISHTSVHRTLKKTSSSRT